VTRTGGRFRGATNTTMKIDAAHNPTDRTHVQPGEPVPRHCILPVAAPRHDFLLALFARPVITTEAIARPAFRHRPKFRTGDFP